MPYRTPGDNGDQPPAKPQKHTPDIRPGWKLVRDEIPLKVAIADGLPAGSVFTPKTDLEALRYAAAKAVEEALELQQAVNDYILAADRDTGSQAGRSFKAGEEVCDVRDVIDLVETLLGLDLRKAANEKRAAAGKFERRFVMRVG